MQPDTLVPDARAAGHFVSVLDVRWRAACVDDETVNGDETRSFGRMSASKQHPYARQ